MKSIVQFVGAIIAGAFAFILTASSGFAIVILAALLGALPIFLLWQWLAPVYFGFVPALYQNVGYLELAGLLALVGMVKRQFYK